MDERQIELSRYRIQEAKTSFKVAENCLKDNFIRILLIAPIMQRFML